MLLARVQLRERTLLLLRRKTTTRVISILLLCLGCLVLSEGLYLYPASTTTTTTTTPRLPSRRGPSTTTSKLLYERRNPPSWSGGSSYLESLDDEDDDEDEDDDTDKRTSSTTYDYDYDWQLREDEDGFLRFISQSAAAATATTLAGMMTTMMPDNISLMLQSNNNNNNNNNNKSNNQPPPQSILSEEDRFLQMVSTEVQVKKLLNQNPYALPDIRFDVLFQRFLDNLEDATQKNNGKVKGQSKLRREWAPQEERPTVVVLGTGWAAHGFVKLASTYDLRIVVVSPINHFIFTPMLASAAVGTIEYRSMTEPIRVTNPFLDNFVEGRAIGVNVEEQTLQVRLRSMDTITRTAQFRGTAAQAPCRLEPEEQQQQQQQQQQQSQEGTTTNGINSGNNDVIELTYDYLVCAVGTSVRSGMVPGAKEYCFNLKTSQDSKRLRTAIGEALEYASRPDVKESYYPPENWDLQEQARQERKRRLRFAVVGGGPTGVELAGELSDFFRQICRKPDGAYQHLADDISVVLIHGGSELLPQMDGDLRQRALEALQAQGVEIRLNTRLQEVGQDFVKIQEKGTSDLQDTTIPVGLTVWAAGNAPVPFVEELLSQLPESARGSAGRINIDPWLRCPTPSPETFGSILVLGDVACLEGAGKYDEPAPLPQTAQVAGQQGAFAARMLNRGYDLQQTPPQLKQKPDNKFSLLRIWLLARGLDVAPEFTFLNLGLLAYVGGGEALNQVTVGDVPLFNYSGKIAFALWRSVYLSKQAATRNQALIAFDWLRTELFGRDITRL